MTTQNLAYIGITSPIRYIASPVVLAGNDHTMHAFTPCSTKIVNQLCITYIPDFTFIVTSAINLKQTISRKWIQFQDNVNIDHIRIPTVITVKNRKRFIKLARPFYKSHI